MSRSNRTDSAPIIRFTNKEQLAVVAMVVGFLIAIWIPALARADRVLHQQELYAQEDIHHG